jgi:hypothetical protein
MLDGGASLKDARLAKKAGTQGRPPSVPPGTKQGRGLKCPGPPAGSHRARPRL